MDDSVFDDDVENDSDAFSPEPVCLHASLLAKMVASWLAPEFPHWYFGISWNMTDSITL